MLYDYQQQKQKQQELKEAQGKTQRENARKTLKKYSTRENRGQAKKVIDDAKNLAKSATPWGIFSLALRISPSDWMYFAALLAAILKDVLDLIEAALITYIIIIVITLCISAFIAMMMFLGSFAHGQGRRQQKIIRSWLILLGGTGAEMIFGLNFMPIETLTVLFVWGLVLSERKQTEKERGLAKRQEANNYA